ncbi:ribonuclease J [Arcanobacterium wilhelmae]|uniref:Ribonuclease J n=1 Tax=Arcanobacterium wilhelmae TaxID=1803177 RepID=A0ABT9N9A9_9ACTO|nr:ribonuclease J [Arcanobacterium wilhelmae]MDP9800287.1 ribonuclease J [Arcanobacterium wilhelmae]WFN89724.1 ribonuclease J [Arcanobacterium wilhelmae]
MTKEKLPAPLAPDTVRIVPLGGIGEIGRNMTVFECNGRLLVVDCGVLFPEENQPGIDLILPDFTYIKDRLDDIDAIVLTHGHEDHIGGVPYLLRMRKDIPLVGSELTIALVESKLAEHRIQPYTLVVKEGDVEQLGAFECEFIAVNHSIPDALAVLMKSKGGTILHTGDFKMDQLPLDGRVTDLRAFARAGDDGVDLFMVDSTNAEIPGFIRSEAEIGPVIESVFAQATGKVVVASFASHVHRVQQVLNAAHKYGRKVCFVGRSMVKNMGIAADLGYLDVPENTLIDLKKSDSVPPQEICYMSTGSQGEPMAVLSRIASGTHKSITVGPGDTVILASSLIPGNENSVFGLINRLTKLGTNVVHKGNARVHVSGHCAEGELLYAYNIVEPVNVMPIHGEPRHLVANGKLAVKTGVPPENVILAEDGTVVDLHDGMAKIVGKVDVGLVFVDGSSVGEISEADLTDRLTLGAEGFISIFAVVDGQERTILTGPHIQARGMAEDDSVFEDIQADVTDALQKAVLNESNTPYQMQQAMRRVIGRWAARKLRRSPMILPTVIEV